MNFRICVDLIILDEPRDNDGYILTLPSRCIYSVFHYIGFVRHITWLLQVVTIEKTNYCLYLTLFVLAVNRNASDNASTVCRCGENRPRALFAFDVMLLTAGEQQVAIISYRLCD